MSVVNKAPNWRRSLKIKPTNISEWKAILEDKIMKILKIHSHNCGCHRSWQNWQGCWH